jgi:enamine deaminase RidA (YjgF/YER057c/UK114 family)
MNAIYGEFFGDSRPARATVVTGFAVPGIRIEIDAIAYKPR